MSKPCILIVDDDRTARVLLQRILEREGFRTLVCGDGQSNWYKGVQLVTVYTIIALMFYLIPATGH